MICVFYSQSENHSSFAEYEHAIDCEEGNTKNGGIVVNGIKAPQQDTFLVVGFIGLIVH
jgi:hypothetical protein